MAPESKAYCLDTSGLSNPLEGMPEDVHTTLWRLVAERIEIGKFAVTKEIYDELCHLQGPIGDCIRINCDAMQLEVGEEHWDWGSYLNIVDDMRIRYKDFISEYNDFRKGTVGLVDVSIVALAKTIGLPVVSMEAASHIPSDKKMRIPAVCAAEGVQHLTFTQLLRAEGISY